MEKIIRKAINLARQIPIYTEDDIVSILIGKRENMEITEFISRYLKKAEVIESRKEILNELDDNLGDITTESKSDN